MLPESARDDPASQNNAETPPRTNAESTSESRARVTHPTTAAGNASITQANGSGIIATLSTTHTTTQAHESAIAVARSRAIEIAAISSIAQIATPIVAVFQCSSIERAPANGREKVATCCTPLASASCTKAATIPIQPSKTPMIENAGPRMRRSIQTATQAVATTNAPFAASDTIKAKPPTPIANANAAAPRANIAQAWLIARVGSSIAASTPEVSPSSNSFTTNPRSNKNCPKRSAPVAVGSSSIAVIDPPALDQFPTSTNAMHALAIANMIRFVTAPMPRNAATVVSAAITPHQMIANANASTGLAVAPSTTAPRAIDATKANRRTATKRGPPIK